MKKGKPITIVKMDQKDSYGNTSFVVTFDNGDSGFFRTKNENQTKFVIGLEVEYEAEVKTGKSGKPYTTINLPKDENSFQGKGGFQKVDPKIQMISFSMSYAKDLIVAGKVEYKDLKAAFENIHSLMISKL